MENPEAAEGKSLSKNYIGWLNQQRLSTHECQTLSIRLTLAQRAIAFTRGKLRHGAGNILAQSEASKQYSVKYARLAYEKKEELWKEKEAQDRIALTSPEDVFEEFMKVRGGERTSVSKRTAAYFRYHTLKEALAAQAIVSRKTGAGNCDHFAAISFFYLLEHAVKNSCVIFRLGVTSSEGGHSVVVIADADWTPDIGQSAHAYKTAVVVDAWPTNAFAVRWHDWFYKREHPKIVLAVSPAADNPGVRKKVLSSYRADFKTQDTKSGRGIYDELRLLKTQSLLDFKTPVSERPDLKLEPTYQQWTDEHPLRVDHPLVKRKKDDDDDDCFITTACTIAQGLPDDCTELTVLRQYRDGYLRARPDGPALIEEYYRVAPLILAAIEREPHAPTILAGLHSRITACVELIGRGENETALDAYRDMVEGLARRYLAPEVRLSEGAGESMARIR